MFSVKGREKPKSQEDPEHGKEILKGEMKSQNTLCMPGMEGRLD